MVSLSTSLPDTTKQPLPAEADLDRYASFARAVEDLQRRLHAEVGPEDLTYIRRVHGVARTCEVIGRTILHFSFEPLSFLAGVLVLFVSKQLDAGEIGHTVLHGTYDKLDPSGRFHSRRYRWPIPIDEEAWRAGHNVRHHMNTNIMWKDSDMDFGPVRLTEQTEHRAHHRVQLLFTLLGVFPNFAFLMNLHFTGLLELQGTRKNDPTVSLPDRSEESIKKARRQALRKYARYYAKEYVLFPLLAGPFFWKILLGNWLSEVLRDVYSAAMIYPGHTGDAKSYPAGTKARSRGEWYAMQVETTNDYDVSWPISVLCGGLNLQIEHHLFPSIAPPRLRKIVPEVRRICAEHGIEYRSGSWPKMLGRALQRIGELQDPNAKGVLARIDATLGTMT